MMKGIGVWGWMARGALFVAVVFALLWVVTWWLSFRWTDGVRVASIDRGQFFVYAGYEQHGRRITRGPVVGWRLYEFLWFEWPESHMYRSVAVPLWAPVIVFGALAWRWRRVDAARKNTLGHARPSAGERRWRRVKRRALFGFVLVMACWYLTQGRDVFVVWPAIQACIDVVNGECRVRLFDKNMVRTEPLWWGVGIGGSDPWYWYYMSGQWGGVMIFLNLLIPAAGLLAVGTLGWRMELRAARIRMRGGCPGCRYSLKGIGGVCPECGRGEGEENRK